MVSITSTVAQLVRESNFLAEGMGQGLFNLSALARALQPQIAAVLRQPVRHGAVLMALRRLSARLSRPRAAKALLLSGLMHELSSRTGLTLAVYVLSGESGAQRRDLVSHAQRDPGSFLSVTLGSYALTVICSRSIEGVLASVFGSEQPIATVYGLSALTVHLGTAGCQRGAVYDTVLRMLAREGIDVVTLVLMHAELTVLVEQHAVSAAHTVLASMVAR